MAWSRQAGIILPGYNPLRVANAPTIGTATVASGTSVSVAFTAPSCIGGGAISSYTAYANCGIYTASGASSPLTVSGLTTGTAYTFRVIATNAFGPSFPSAASNSVSPIVQGQQAYTSAGTFSWVAPAGVTSVSVVAVGSGASGAGSCAGGTGGAAGGLAYKNNITVVPGNSYSVVVGAGRSGTSGVGTSGQASSFTALFGTMTAGGGSGSGGSPSGVFDGGGNGGCRGNGVGGGGGGAGGYAGNGGAGAVNCGSGLAGSGGGGGGGNASSTVARGGGGVGILGQGANGAANGGGGSGGSSTSSKTGGAYGGGGGGAPMCAGGDSGRGAVRIIWPGTSRSFPSTNTGNL